MKWVSDERSKRRKDYATKGICGEKNMRRKEYATKGVCNERSKSVNSKSVRSNSIRSKSLCSETWLSEALRHRQSGMGVHAPLLILVTTQPQEQGRM